MDNKELVTKAIEAKTFSYSPYSNFKVGAALLSKDGRVFTGANIENAAYSPTNCAERTVVFKAVSEGVKEFAAIAITGGFSDSQADYCYPCGVCRQVLNEFVDANDFTVIIAKNIDDYRVCKLSELLPFGFGPNDLR